MNRAIKPNELFSRVTGDPLLISCSGQECIADLFHDIQWMRSVNLCLLSGGRMVDMDAAGSTWKYAF